MDLNFKRFGTGQPVVILHGLFGMLDNWQTFSRHLSSSYQVYPIDLRNHGKSPHADQFNYSVMAADIYGFLKKNNIPAPVHLIGHSMGGKVAMQFALQFPELVEKLVVADIAPKAYPPGHEDIFEALFALDLENITSRKEAAEAMAKFIDEEAVRLFLLKNLGRNNSSGFRWKMNLPVIYQNYKEVLAPIVGNPVTLPTLFVKGGKSPYIQDKDHSDIQVLFPKADFSTVKDAGHWIHAEKPKEMLAVVTNFF